MCAHARVCVHVCFPTAEALVPPLQRPAVRMNTLPRELGHGLAEDGLCVVGDAHVGRAGLDEGVHVQKVLAAAEWSAGEDLLAERLRRKIHG